jgi:glycosyltransferase involved in cell wall biosynthesis
VLLHPSRILRRKNVELTLAVTAAINDLGRSCACVITAPPDAQNRTWREYREELAALARARHLDGNAYFLDDRAPLAADEMRALFAVADALFFPSRQEGFGVPLLEAAIHRLPIFCSDIEPLNALLAHGVSTFSLSATPAEIAALIMGVLEHDSAWSARKETVRKYSWRAIYRNFLSPLIAETKTP